MDPEIITIIVSGHRALISVAATTPLPSGMSKSSSSTRGRRRSTRATASRPVAPVPSTSMSSSTSSSRRQALGEQAVVVDDHDADGARAGFSVHVAVDGLHQQVLVEARGRGLDGGRRVVGGLMRHLPEPAGQLRAVLGRGADLAEVLVHRAALHRAFDELAVDQHDADDVVQVVRDGRELGRRASRRRGRPAGLRGRGDRPGSHRSAAACARGSSARPVAPSRGHRPDRGGPRPGTAIPRRRRADSSRSTPAGRGPGSVTRSATRTSIEQPSRSCAGHPKSCSAPGSTPSILPLASTSITASGTGASALAPPVVIRLHRHPAAPGARDRRHAVRLSRTTRTPDPAGTPNGRRAPGARAYGEVQAAAGRRPARRGPAPGEDEMALPQPSALASPSSEPADSLFDRRLAALLEAAPDALVCVEPSGRIAQLNERVGALFGYDRDELLGAEVELLLPEALRGRPRRVTGPTSTPTRGCGRWARGWPWWPGTATGPRSRSRSAWCRGSRASRGG